MSDEIKDEILVAWNRYLTDHQRRLKKNEGSSTQYDDAFRLFKQGILEHPKLSKREKEELLVQISVVRAKSN
jgi:hypothetical protein